MANQLIMRYNVGDILRGRAIVRHRAGGRKPETEAETRDRSTGSVIMVLLTQWYTYRSAEETHVSFVRGFAA